MSSNKAEGNNQTSETRIERLRQRVHQLLDAQHTLQQRCDDLSQQGTAWRNQEHALHEQINALTQERDLLKSDRDALAASQQALESECGSLHGERNAVQAQQDALQSECDGLRAERDGLIDKLTKLTSEYRGLQEKHQNPVILNEIVKRQLRELISSSSYTKTGRNGASEEAKENDPIERKLAATTGTISPLRENSMHGFAAQHAICHYKSNSICTFIPKNACTNIRYSLAIANGAIQGHEDFHWIHANNDAFLASGIKEILSASYTFIVLRNPFTRLASYFFNKIVGQPAAPTDLSGDFARNLFSVDSNNTTFKIFVDQLWDHPEKLRQDEHIRPQVDFLIYQDYDDWFCVEKFENAVKEVKRKTGLDLIDTRGFSSHTTHGLEIAAQDGLMDASVDALRQWLLRGKAPRWVDLYDEEVAFKVASLYLSDIRLYFHHFRDQALDCKILKMSAIRAC